MKEFSLGSLSAARATTSEDHSDSEAASASAVDLDLVESTLAKLGLCLDKCGWSDSFRLQPPVSIEREQEASSASLPGAAGVEKSEESTKSLSSACAGPADLPGPSSDRSADYHGRRTRHVLDVHQYIQALTRGDRHPPPEVLNPGPAQHRNRFSSHKSWCPRYQPPRSDVVDRIERDMCGLPDELLLPKKARRSCDKYVDPKNVSQWLRQYFANCRPRVTPDSCIASPKYDRGMRAGTIVPESVFYFKCERDRFYDTPRPESRNLRVKRWCTLPAERRHDVVRAGCRYREGWGRSAVLRNMEARRQEGWAMRFASEDCR
jgi:hypothetical protein